MTSTDHPLDDLALYALDALEPDEARAVEAHLAGCAACRDELDAHRATLGALTVDEAPPPSVWAGIAREIGAADTPTPLPVVPPAAGPRPPLAAVPSPADGAGGAGAGRPAGASPLAPAPPSHLRRGRGGSRRWLVAVAAVAAAVVLVAGTVALVRPDKGGTGDLNDLAQAALEAPGSRVITLTTEDGDQAARLVVDGHDGYLLVDDLTTLPSGQEYQLWKLGGPAPVSLGMVGDGGDSVASVGVPADTNQLALSTEPAAGSVAPTGPIVATGQA